MKIIVAGDFCERYRISDIIKKEAYGQLFDDNVRTIITGSDYSIVNFEFPIVVGNKNPIAKCGPNLKGSPKSVEAIKYAGFKCCTLANNHILDYGHNALLETKRFLQEGSIDTVGVGENLELAGTILYKKINGEILAIINCCEHEFSIASQNSPGANPLNPVRQYYAIQEARRKAKYVLVIVHGGHEHWQLPSPRMQELYRYFIDCGADAVVNHHQHCYSGSEIYNGKPIIYGLGNFCFDIEPKRTDDIWNYGCMAMITFDNNVVTYELVPIEQCREEVNVKLSDRLTFEKRQKELNNIISNNVKLYEETMGYYNDSMALCSRVMNPTRNRILLALQNRNLLPTPFSKEWVVSVENFVMCEAHRDKMAYFFINNRK